MKKMFLENWKTTIAGVVVAVAIYLRTKDVINEDVMNLIFGIGTAFGLVFAKDANKSTEK